MRNIGNRQTTIQRMRSRKRRPPPPTAPAKVSDKSRPFRAAKKAAVHEMR